MKFILPQIEWLEPLATRSVGPERWKSHELLPTHAQD